jgi:hypothetical protein
MLLYYFKIKVFFKKKVIEFILIGSIRLNTGTKYLQLIKDQNQNQKYYDSGLLY